MTANLEPTFSSLGYFSWYKLYRMFSRHDVHAVLGSLQALGLLSLLSSNCALNYAIHTYHIKFIFFPSSVPQGMGNK